ncbi:hypothetical protein SDC9_195538 [bioreactor metagenome]|uniref:Uncharacterized protein n=1 Tax=bioreactor metagenome TaxID=1076179 RepID=A0A645IHZ6_9ZZZZ
MVLLRQKIKDAHQTKLALAVTESVSRLCVDKQNAAVFAKNGYKIVNGIEKQLRHDGGCFLGGDVRQRVVNQGAFGVERIFSHIVPSRCAVFLKHYRFVVRLGVVERGKKAGRRTRKRFEQGFSRLVFRNRRSADFREESRGF